MRHVILLALILGTNFAFAQSAEGGKAVPARKTAKVAKVAKASRRGPASVMTGTQAKAGTPTNNGKNEIDSDLGELQHTLEQVDVGPDSSQN